MKPKNADLWVVETDFYTTVPRVKKYTGRRHKKGAMVVVRGFEKYMPPALGRRFFADEIDAAAFVRGWCEDKLRILGEQAGRVQAALSEIDILAAVHAERVPDTQPPKTKIKLADLD